MPGQKITWTVDRRYESRFTDSVLNDIVSKKIVSKEAVVRELEGRRVSFLSLKPDNLPDVYLKSYWSPPSKLYRAFVFPYGMKEWRVAQQLVKKGIQICPPVALGIEKRWRMFRNVYFITEAVPDSMTLKEYIDKQGVKGDHGQLPEGKDLIDQFAAFVSDIRRVGILHSDFHWGNVLVRVSENSPPSFYLIDLHNVKLKRTLSSNDSLTNLVLLNASFLGRIPTRAQINFLRIYFKEIVKKREIFSRIREKVKGEAEKLVLKRWKKQARRCLGENKYFKKVELNGLKGYARKSDGTNVLIRLVEEPDRLFAKEGVVILKDSRTTSSLVLRSEGLGSGIYMKRFNAKGPLYILKNMLRWSRAKRVWYAANSMTAREVPTPQPLLYLEQRRLRVLFKSYFATEMIPGAQTLDSYVTAGFEHFSPGQKLSIIRNIAQHVRLMHERGICHGDLKAKNILVQKQSEGKVKVFFADLDAVKVTDRLTFRHRCRDIARLNCSFLNTAVVSKTHRFYFLKYYLGKVRRKDLEKAWDTVMFFTEQKLRKSGRSFTGP